MVEERTASPKYVNYAPVYKFYTSKQKNGPMNMSSKQQQGCNRNAQKLKSSSPSTEHVHCDTHSLTPRSSVSTMASPDLLIRDGRAYQRAKRNPSSMSTVSSWSTSSSGSYLNCYKLGKMYQERWCKDFGSHVRMYLDPADYQIYEQTISPRYKQNSSSPKFTHPAQSNRPFIRFSKHLEHSMKSSDSSVSFLTNSFTKSRSSKNSSDSGYSSSSGSCTISLPGNRFFLLVSMVTLFYLSIF